MILFLVLAFVHAASATFGGCCGGGYALPPPPCPPPVCAPPPPPCPPPPVCPPQFCPPPAPCPPPPPPPPPPMCPPPPPPAPCQSYAPAPVFASYAMQPANDCCCRCGIPCQFRARHRTHGSKIFSAATAEIEEDPTCNSEKLKKVMEEYQAGSVVSIGQAPENMSDDPSTSKREIQKAAEEKLFGKFNVICSKGDFSYVAYTETYCQRSNDDVTCYAFRPM